jgi:hypothetical protein
LRFGTESHDVSPDRVCLISFYAYIFPGFADGISSIGAQKE